jgi:hypothetical protein
VILKRILPAGVAVLMLVTGTACFKSKADVAAHNLSVAAENFEVSRRIVFFNGITDKYLLTVEGRCSVESSNSALGGSLEVTCKTGPNDYKKHFLGLSDNVSYFVEQTEPVAVDSYHYRVIFRPDTIIPAVELDKK